MSDPWQSILFSKVVCDAMSIKMSLIFSSKRGTAILVLTTIVIKEIINIPKQEIHEKALKKK